MATVVKLASASVLEEYKYIHVLVWPDILDNTMKLVSKCKDGVNEYKHFCALIYRLRSL